MRICLSVLAIVFVMVTLSAATDIGPAAASCKKVDTCQLMLEYFGPNTWIPTCEGNCDCSGGDCTLIGWIFGRAARCSCYDGTDYILPEADCYGEIEDMRYLNCQSYNCSAPTCEENYPTTSGPACSCP